VHFYHKFNGNHQSPSWVSNAERIEQYLRMLRLRILRSLRIELKKTSYVRSVIFL